MRLRLAAFRGLDRLTLVGWVLLVVLLLPPVRQALESSMSLHMLVQYTGLMLAGALLANRLNGDAAAMLQRWNELGIAGLLGSAITLALLMLPRVLDLALVDARIEGLKLAALLMTGAALRLSWQRAGLVVQAFFLGNVLPMTVVVGTLYQDSTSRVCNAYLLDDQRWLGLGLVWIAVAIAAAWLLRLEWQRQRAEAQTGQPRRNRRAGQRRT